MLAVLVMLVVLVVLTAINGPAAQPPRQPVDTSSAPVLSPTAARSAGSPPPAGPPSRAPQRCPVHTATHLSTPPGRAAGVGGFVVTLTTLTIIADKGKVCSWTSSDQRWLILLPGSTCR